MRTLIIYDDIESPHQYIIVEGDYSRFHGVKVNAGYGTGYEEEFCEWMFDEGGERRHLGQWSEDKTLIENKEWDKVAVCTFLP